jgi:O-succinylbenzoic acid--CoA ligase
VTREPVDWPTDDPLAHRVRSTPERTALVDADEDRTLTYRQLDAHVDQVAGALAHRGVQPGDRVGMLRSNSASVVELVHALLRLRATLVPLNVELTAAELAPQLRRAELDWLVCEEQTESTAAEVFDPASTLSGDEPTREAAGRLDRPIASLPERPPLTRDRTVLVMFTSGTTGEPKGVRLTAGNLVASATASAFRLGVTREDRWLVCLPTYHMGGLAPLVRSTLYGTAVVLQRSFDAGTTGRVVANRDVTGVSLVPTMLTRLLDAGWEAPAHLRFVLLGGAPSPADLVARCEREGVPVHPTYGTTETASQIATAPPGQAFAHEGTVGQPLLCTEVTVLDREGDPVEAGETGELVVEGPTVTPGYLDDERTGAAFGPHGLHTGDVGYRDDDGRLWVVGRTDDTVLTGGENVHPAEVAAVVRDHQAVEDAAVVGLPDPEWGERLAALVVGDVAADELDAHCRERLAPFKTPKTWGLADALPRTASGTVDREAVRERLTGE